MMGTLLRRLRHICCDWRRCSRKPHSNKNSNNPTGTSWLCHNPWTSWTRAGHPVAAQLSNVSRKWRNWAVCYRMSRSISPMWRRSTIHVLFRWDVDKV
jgi:hypothetical protein